jgi:hypothetical protein
MLVVSGCVFPGVLRKVGGQAVEGRLVDPRGHGVPNAEIILVQGRVAKLKFGPRFQALKEEEAAVCHGVELAAGAAPRRAGPSARASSTWTKSKTTSSGRWMITTGTP